MFIRFSVVLLAVVVFTFSAQLIDGTLQDRLLKAEEQARETLRKLLSEARTTLNNSLSSVRGVRVSITETASETAVGAAASLSALLDTVRHAVHSARNSIPVGGAALNCVENAERKAEEVVDATVRGIGICASKAATTDQGLTQHLSQLLHEAERRAFEAASGLGLDACVALPQLKEALNCLVEHVQAIRTDVQNRVGNGVREARALGKKSEQALEGVGDCIESQLQEARQRVANITSSISFCTRILN